MSIYLPSLRIDKIRTSEQFVAALSLIEELEAERIFCRHDMAHFLDVARIMTLLRVEYNLFLPADEIYAAALLHDLGRSKGGEGHAAASVVIAEQVLPQCGFSPAEIRRICSAIAAHGDKGEKEAFSKRLPDKKAEMIYASLGIEDMFEQEESVLGRLLIAADKLSRRCYECAASKECRWKVKNEVILI